MGGRKRRRSSSTSSRSSSTSSSSSSSTSSSEARRKRRKQEKKRAKKDKKAKPNKLEKVKLELLEGKADAKPGDTYLTFDDYFRKQAEFMVWLNEKKGMRLEEAGKVEETHMLFCKFAKAWNAKTLSRKYYDGMTSTGVGHTARTKFRWGFADKLDEKTRLELDTARDSTDTSTNQLSWKDLTKPEKGSTCRECKGPWPCRNLDCSKGRPERGAGGDASNCSGCGGSWPCRGPPAEVPVASPSVLQEDVRIAANDGWRGVPHPPLMAFSAVLCRALLPVLLSCVPCDGSRSEPLSEAVELGSLVHRTRMLDGAAGHVSERCHAMHFRDYDVAEATVRLPMNAYELFSLCPSKAGADGAGMTTTRKDGATSSIDNEGLAVFIMAHECGGLDRLIERLLYKTAVHVVVNVDGSERDAVACVKDVLAGVRERHPGVLMEMLTDDVEWGSWGMIMAEVHAMEVFMARRATHPWSHMLVISGSCYPLVTAEHLVRWFAAHPGSFYYTLPMDGATREWMLTQMTTVCEGRIFHVGLRSEVPPASFFTVANTWKFWDAGFVAWVVAGADGLLWELLKLLSLTLSVDEVFWATLHRNSPFCHALAAVHPREFYMFLWPGDASDRTCPQHILNTPVDWYCPKRPFYFDAPDVPRLPFIPSLFVRKVRSDTVRDAIDRHAKLRGTHDFASVVQASLHIDSPRPVHIQLAAGVREFRLVRDKAGAVAGWEWGARLRQPEFMLGRCEAAVAEGCEGGDVCVGEEAAAERGAYCRIHVRHAPSLCLTFKDNEVRLGNFMGIAQCAPYAEPQLFVASTAPRLQSAAKVSLHQYRGVGGLCVTYDASATDPLLAAPLQPCSPRNPAQDIRLIEVDMDVPLP